MIYMILWYDKMIWQDDMMRWDYHVLQPHISPWTISGPYQYNYNYNTIWLYYIIWNYLLSIINDQSDQWFPLVQRSISTSTRIISFDILKRTTCFPDLFFLTPPLLVFLTFLTTLTPHPVFWDPSSWLGRVGRHTCSLWRILWCETHYRQKPAHYTRMWPYKSLLEHYFAC